MATKSIDSKRLQAALWAAMEEGIEDFWASIGHRDIPLHTFRVFFTIPPTGETTVQNITKVLQNMSQAAVSRNVALLCGVSKIRADGGLNLCQYREDMQDRRYKMISLSPRGKEVRDSMLAHMTTMFERITSIE